MLRRLELACEAFRTPGHRAYLDFRERTQRIWRERTGIFTVIPTLDALATAYAFTGDAAHGDFAREAVLAVIEHGLADVKSLSYGAPNSGWRRGPGHDKGKFAQCLSWVYDVCYDRFSPGDRARFAAYARECVELAKESRAFDQAQVANNRGIAGLLVPFFFALALEGDADGWDAEAAASQAAIDIEKYLFLSFDQDGAPYEGPGYAGRIAFAAFAAEILRRRGGPNLLTNNRFERFLEYLLYELLPGGVSAHDLNDTRIPNGSVAGCLHLLGSGRGDLLPWLARRLDLHPARLDPWLEGEDWEPGSFSLSSFLPFLIHWRDDAPVCTPEELGYSRSHAFPVRGVASMRSGWEADDLFASHFCGRQELYCHRQGDFNHVSLYALGEAFLIDAGYGHPWADASQPVDRWFGLTAAHNAVLVDGMNQRGVVAAPGWAEGELVEFQHQEDFDSSLGDASSCTGPDHRVRRALRRVALVRGGPAPFLAVLDVVEKDGRPFLAECLWHTSPDHRVRIVAQGFVLEGRTHRCEALVLWPDPARLGLADSFGRPQVRVSVGAPVAEILTVFCPRRSGERAPRFTAAREAEGRFRITCEMDGKSSCLHLTAGRVMPLRRPLPVGLEVS